MKAYLRAIMKRRAKRFDCKPDVRTVDIIDYYDGSADAVIEERWSEAYQPVLTLASALCPITADEIRELKPLWHNVYPVYKMRYYKVFRLKWDKFPVEVNQYVGGLLRRKNCIHRPVEVIESTRPLPFLGDFI